jgi:predicted nucleic acid-binding protein
VRIYPDATPVIFLVEQVPPYATQIEARLSAPGVVCVSSDLTRLECRVKPLRAGNAALLQDFETFFLTSVAEMVLLSHAVLERATEIRAQFGFRTPDAIHLAAAIESGCDVFLTRDQRLAKFNGITIELL